LEGGAILLFLSVFSGCHAVFLYEDPVERLRCWNAAFACYGFNRVFLMLFEQLHGIVQPEVVDVVDKVGARKADEELTKLVSGHIHPIRHIFTREAWLEEHLLMDDIIFNALEESLVKVNRVWHNRCFI